MESLFTIKGVFNEAFAIIKPKFWTVIGQFALITFVYMVLAAGFNQLFVLRAIVAILYSFIITVFSLSYVEKGSFAFDDVLRSLKLKPFSYFIAATILFGLSVLIGTILLVVPGLIVGVMMGMYKYIVIEKEMSPVEALKESIRITKGYRWKIFGFMMLSVLLVILGFICVFVGALFTFPLVMIANALIYKKISADTKTEEPVEEIIEVDVVTVV